MSELYYATKNIQWKGGVVSQGAVVKVSSKEDIKKATDHKYLKSEKEFLEAREKSLASQRATSEDKFREEAEKANAEVERLQEELKAEKAKSKGETKVVAEKANAEVVPQPSEWDAKVAKAKVDGYTGALSHSAIDKFYADKEANKGE